MMNLAMQNIFVHTRDILHAIRSYSMGTSGFTSPPKEGMLHIFTTLKNPSLWPDLNLQTLGLMASMLTL
jgi:hypothetical protein